MTLYQDHFLFEKLRKHLGWTPAQMAFVLRSITVGELTELFRYVGFDDISIMMALDSHTPPGWRPVATGIGVGGVVTNQYTLATAPRGRWGRCAPAPERDADGEDR